MSNLHPVFREITQSFFLTPPPDSGSRVDPHAAVVEPADSPMPVVEPVEPAQTPQPVAENTEDKPTPFFANTSLGIKLYQGDALKMLQEAKSEKFDLIFADSPYFLSNGGISCQNGKMVSVNKGKWDKAPSLSEIHEFNTIWLSECHRLLKPNGTIWVSGTSHNIYSVGFAMQSIGYKILNDIAWFKINPPPNLACRYFTHATETILWARKSEKAKHFFNYAEMKKDNGDKQMQSLWSISPPKTYEKRFGKHPTQKPEKLLDRIIRSASNFGDVVLDPFCGSGTTGVIATRLGRKFVGFDLSEEYLNLAKLRIEDEIEILNKQPFSNEGKL